MTKKNILGERLQQGIDLGKICQVKYDLVSLFRVWWNCQKQPQTLLLNCQSAGIIHGIGQIAKFNFKFGKQLRPYQFSMVNKTE